MTTAAKVFGGLALAVQSLIVIGGCKDPTDDPIEMEGRSGSGRNVSNDSCGTSCDDGFDCTIDRCVSGGCTHSIGPTSGNTSCPSGRYCTVELGCISAPACATDEDCEEAFVGDACKDEPRCDPASSVCIFDLLDKDGDGAAPQICGGDDCDDDASHIYPGALDGCNGRDDDCDGELDEEPYCSPMEQCVDGACQCQPEFLCGGSCVDRESDPEHCGECDHECAEGGLCRDGECTCPGRLELCDDQCVDLRNDEDNCGACGLSCRRDQSCEAGLCVCDDVPRDDCSISSCRSVPTTACGDTCVDITSDPRNCGACGNECVGQVDPTLGHVACERGECVVICDDRPDPGGGPSLRGVLCNGTCVDALFDSANCGECDRRCAQSMTCDRGTCSCPTGSVLCDDTCVDVESDVTNCGECGMSCMAGMECTLGTCQCPEGSTLCGGICKPFDEDSLPFARTTETPFRDWANWPMPSPVESMQPNPARYNLIACDDVCCEVICLLGRSDECEDELCSEAGVDCVVHDLVTSLQWERDVTGASGPLTQAEGAAYCEALKFAGHDDWKLPTRIELVSLVDFTRTGPAIDIAAFPGTPGGRFFWSSTAWAESAEEAWYVQFDDGSSFHAETSAAQWVRCVR